MKTKLISLFLCFAMFGTVCAQQQTDTLIIFFDINKSIVDNQNAEPLSKLLNEENVISINIHGFTDFLGSVSHNRQLSNKRSSNVYNYLVNKGINSSSIHLCRGEGVYPNSAEKNRQDLSDRGIKAHRIVQVVYTAELQDIVIIEEESDENFQEIEIIEEIPVISGLTEENLVVSNQIVLENILFFNASYTFRPESYPALRELLEFMRNHRTLKIEIHGHICCQPDDTQESYVEGAPISLFRAKAVYDFLIQNGISPNRISYKGFGATRKRFPLEQNEFEMYMNRRVEILILEI